MTLRFRIERLYLGVLWITCNIVAIMIMIFVWLLVFWELNERNDEKSLPKTWKQIQSIEFYLSSSCNIMHRISLLFMYFNRVKYLFHIYVCEFAFSSLLTKLEIKSASFLENSLVFMMSEHWPVTVKLIRAQLRTVLSPVQKFRSLSPIGSNLNCCMFYAVMQR